MNEKAVIAKPSKASELRTAILELVDTKHRLGELVAEISDSVASDEAEILIPSSLESLLLDGPDLIIDINTDINNRIDAISEMIL